MPRYALLTACLAAILAVVAVSCTPPPPTPASCTVPVTRTYWGKAETFDQCQKFQFTHAGTSFTILAYYTLTDSSANLAQCTAAENAAGRCEHKLSSADRVPLLAGLVQQAIEFHRVRNLKILEPGHTLEIFVLEAPSDVHALTEDAAPNHMLWDDEIVDATLPEEILRLKREAFHETDHLVQFQYNDLVAKENAEFYAEGIATAVEDRFDAEVDALPYLGFMWFINDLLSSDAKRTSDIVTLSYGSAAWWTWLLDHYPAQGEIEPAKGWSALRDFYITLSANTDQLKALSDFSAARGSSFRDDFIDYTLALYAHKYHPADPRLDFLDAEFHTGQASTLSGHTVFTNNPPFGSEAVTMNPRSSRYWEFSSGQPCDYIAFTFDGHGNSYGFSLLTALQGNLQKRWTSYGKTWAIAVHSKGIAGQWPGSDRVVGVVTAVGDSGQVTVGRGCVSPELNIKDPTNAKAKWVGVAENPHKFIVRLKVTADGSPVAGLTASQFQVGLSKSGGPLLPATIVSAVYVQNDYWLLVQPPDAAAGAETGADYDLIVSMGALTDSETEAVHYTELVQDVMLVFDHSDSMNDDNKIEAARNAANFLVNELGDTDRAGFVVFNNVAELRAGLAELSSGPASYRQTLEQMIAGETAIEWTTIGGGMQLAAGEFDAHRDPAHACSFVLLSDGQENTPPGWVTVQADVIDNGCPIHAIALGPLADEPLMQGIAGSLPGGSFDYADASGSVPLSFRNPEDGPSLSLVGYAAPRPAAAAAVSWQNNLSRLYDNKAAQISGRQRIQSFAEGDNGEYHFYVDDLAEELVIGLAWQDGDYPPTEVEVIDPNGAPATAVRRLSSLGTNEVWTVQAPIPGDWTVRVVGIPQEYIVVGSVLSHYELFVFAGTPIESLTQGVQVPILAAFVGKDAPITGAAITAKVIAPDGSQKTLILYDDGNHLDGEADDGVYGNLYTATSMGDAPPSPNPVEKQEPNTVGSYQVLGIATWNNIRREAQTSFALSMGADLDGDGLPDTWEAANGLDDPGGDPDDDGLENSCEFTLGTDPNNDDTDGGGESDVSETHCDLPEGGRDPLNPEDDLVGPLTFAIATPESDGAAYVAVKWGEPLRGALVHVFVWRREVQPDGSAGGWSQVGSEVQGHEYLDRDVRVGVRYQYHIAPVISPQEPGMESLRLAGAALETDIVQPSLDPYPPGGTVLIQDGAAVTRTSIVALSLSASDEPVSGGAAPFTPVERLEMRLSNTPDFAGTEWMPFQAVVSGWDLGTIAPGGTAVVYVQFRDAAGNIGTGPPDTILYQPAP